MYVQVTPVQTKPTSIADTLYWWTYSQSNATRFTADEAAAWCLVFSDAPEDARWPAFVEWVAGG